MGFGFQCINSDVASGAFFLEFPPGRVFFHGKEIEALGGCKSKLFLLIFSQVVLKANISSTLKTAIVAWFGALYLKHVVLASDDWAHPQIGESL